MWEVIALNHQDGTSRFHVARHAIDELGFPEGECYCYGGEIYSTPYRIEAQQIADELNGELNASN